MPYYCNGAPTDNVAKPTPRSSLVPFRQPARHLRQQREVAVGVVGGVVEEHSQVVDLQEKRAANGTSDVLDSIKQVAVAGTTPAAPAVPPQSPLIIKGGSVRFEPRTNLVTAVAGVASQLLVEPLSDAISDNIIFPLIEKALGRDIPSSAEIRRLQQQPEQVRSLKDAAVEAPAPPQPLVDASVPPSNAIEMPCGQLRIQRRCRRLWKNHWKHIHHLKQMTNAIVSI